MIRKTSIKYIYIYIYTYISFFTTSSATKTSQLKFKKKKKPTTVLTLKTENKNDSIKNQNNFFLGGPGEAVAPPRPPLAPSLNRATNSILNIFEEAKYNFAAFYSFTLSLSPLF